MCITTKLELKLASFRDLLFRIDLYKNIMCGGAYEPSSKRKYMGKLDDLRSSIELEISQLQVLLKTEYSRYHTDNSSRHSCETTVKDDIKVKHFVTELNRVVLNLLQSSM